MAMVKAKKNDVMAWDLNDIREEVKKLLGKKVTVEGHESVQKKFSKEGTLDVVSYRVFTVKMDDTGTHKSFSYNDIVDGNVKIYT